MSDLQTLSVTIGILTACVSVVIGVMNSIRSSREAKEQRQVEIETRQAELFMQIFNQWTNPEFALCYGNIRYNEEYQWKEVEELQQKTLEPWNKERWKHFHSLFQFFEGIGVLVQMQLIDVTLVRNLFSHRIIWYWEYMKPWVYYNRKRVNDPNLADSLENLYNEMVKLESLTTIRP